MNINIFKENQDNFHNDYKSFIRYLPINNKYRIVNILCYLPLSDKEKERLEKIDNKNKNGYFVRLIESRMKKLKIDKALVDSYFKSKDKKSKENKHLLFSILLESMQNEIIRKLDRIEQIKEILSSED